MCIFCKIINNEIPSYKVYEDDEVLAILDISQITDGHTLVMPKKHYKNLLDASDEDINKCMSVVKKLSKDYESKLNALGFNILSNVNEVSGQSVDHLHFHIVPRYSKEDAINLNFVRNTEFDLKEIYNRIIK